jgi:transposase
MKNTLTKFKLYQQNQLTALPLTFDELIESTHPVRVVNEIVWSLSIFAPVLAYCRLSVHKSMQLLVK